MTNPLPQQHFSGSHDFVVEDHEHLRVAIRALAKRRGKTVGQLSLAAKAGTAPINFATEGGKVTGSISISVLLRFFTTHGVQLSLRPYDGDEGGDDDRQVANNAELRAFLMESIKASGNTVNAVCTVSGGATALTKFLLHPGEHENIKAMLIWRLFETLQIKVRLVDELKGRRAK